VNELAQSARAGDPETVSRLLRALAPVVRHTCRGALGSSHPDLEDAIQESLIAIIRALPAWRSEGDFIHYAMKISLRVALATRRRSRRTERLELNGVSGHAPQPEAASQNDAAADAEQAEVLRLLIRTLADDQAEVLLLRFVFGYSLQETAQITAVPLNTAKTRIRLAKNALRRKIAANPQAFALSGTPSK
jgi:RNA polymerase sigma factor (sigma-70 family)